MGDVVERAVLLLAPPRDRESILGDLDEDSAMGRGGGRVWRLVELARVGLRYQGEPYRAVDGRLGALLLLGIGVALLEAIPGSTGMSAVVYHDPISRAVMRLWQHGEYLATVAAGLLIGRLPVVGEASSAVRWHVGVVLALVLASGAWLEVSLLAPVLLLLTLWLGDRARSETPPSPLS